VRWAKDEEKRVVLAPARPKIEVHTKLNKKVLYTNIVTTDKQTQGYGSNFVLIKHPKQLWGFHILWLSIDGGVQSATMATPVTLGNIKIGEYGQVFLDRFTLILERITEVPNILGNTPQLDQKLTRETGWSAQNTINSLLQMVYTKMWDLDVRVTPFNEIPIDVVEDLRRICADEFRTELPAKEAIKSFFDGMKPR
jgi:hypothetical protein